MGFILSIIVLGISWFIGVIGWAQIVGGFQNLRSRSNLLITIIIWAAIIIGSYFVVKHFFSSRIIYWVIGMAVALVQVLLQGRIE